MNQSVQRTRLVEAQNRLAPGQIRAVTTLVVVNKSLSGGWEIEECGASFLGIQNLLQLCQVFVEID